MTTIVYILVAILIFGILIAVHELGHFLAAKACGVTVNEFSIGMGPALWKKQKGETLYALRATPCGCFRWAVSVPWKAKRRIPMIRQP